MPMDRKRYPNDWKAISQAIKDRAGWKCEYCGVAHGAPLPSGRPGKVVLTTAHIGASHPDGRSGDKHDKMDVRPENLRALCPACHLRKDMDEHIDNARKTRARKKQAIREAAGQMALFE